MKRVLASAVALAVLMLCAHPRAHAAFLDGQTLGYEYLFPDLGTVFFSTSFVVGAGVELPNMTSEFSAPASVDVSDTNIFIDFLVDRVFSPGSFNGFHMFDLLGTIESFGSVGITLATNLAGFNSSLISFDANNLFVNFDALDFDANSIVSIDIRPVPEPSTLLLVGLGLSMAGIAGWRRGRSNRQ